MVGGNAVAPGEGRDNYDGSYKIDTNLLNEENFISQYLVYLLSIRTSKNAQIKIRVVMKKFVQDKRRVKLTEKTLTSWKRLRDTGQIFKLFCNLEIQKSLYSDELIK